MAKKQYIYIDLGRDDGPTAIAFCSPNVTAVYTGLEIHTEQADPLVEELSRLSGIHFFTQKPPDLHLYGVPFISVFASDDRGGYFASIGDTDREPIVHIAPDLTVTPVADHLKALIDLAGQDPDWRAKYLPGQWAPLPEDPEGRRKLAEGLKLSPPDEPRQAALPLRVFPSREAAEKEFPIQDLWTVLRSKKEPRFQVWPAMSPEDRAGRAYVHYTAWQETYTGLMDPRVLAWNTPERCRESAEKHSQNTLVLLDREQNDRVAGFACYQHRARVFTDLPEAGEITALYILKEYQGLGLGRMLIEHCLAHLPNPSVALVVVKGNDRAIGFYEHMGFRLTGQERTHSINGGETTGLEMVLDK